MRRGICAGLHGDAEAPRLLIGSHLDTVPNAGAFDGSGRGDGDCAGWKPRPRIAVEVVGFSEEEGVRFGFPFIGSRALVGTLDERFGRRVRWRFRFGKLCEFGLDPAGLPRRSCSR